MNFLRFVILCLLLTLSAQSENWPRFRGPGGQGHSEEKDLPLHWSMTEKVAWKTAVPGSGWSSPVVWGTRVIVTSTTDQDQSCRVICLNLETGKTLWNTEVFRQIPQRKERKNSYATPTPVLDASGACAVFGNGNIAKVDWSGKVKWVNNDVDFYSRHGLGASPLLVGNTLIMPYDGSNRVPQAGQWPNNSREERIGWQIPWDKAELLAVDIQTGKTIWRAKRGMSRIAHVSPNLAVVNGKRQVISPAGDVIQGFDPENGNLIWTARSQGEGVTPGFAVGDGLVFTASGFEKSTIRTVRLGGRGNVTKTHIAWEQRKGVPTESSLLYISPRLYAVNGGVVTCYQGQTGKILWQERIGGQHSASPIYVDGRIYWLSESGTTTVLQSGPEFKILARNPLRGHFQASPAVSNGNLLLRSDKMLYCIR